MAVRSLEARDHRGSWAVDALGVGLPLLALYLLTVSRDLGTIDSGELAAVCARLGVAHPTGYALYSLLGRLAVLLGPGPPILQVNLLSAVTCAVAGVLCARLAREILPHAPAPLPAAPPMDRSGGSGEARAARPRSGRLREGKAWLWLPPAAGLWLGTSRVFWEQATGNEVYGLHLLFVILLLLLGARLLRLSAPAPRREGAGKPASPADLLLLAWILGLSLANHLSTVFVLPALALAAGLAGRRMMAADHFLGRRRLSPAVWVAACAVFLLLAWSVVLALPVRSLCRPLLDWGGVDGWGRFWRHALAAQYRVWFFESGRLWAENLGNYARSLPQRLSWPLVVLAVAGTLDLWRRGRLLLLYLGLVLLVTLLWASSYDIHDLAPYYLPADLSLVLLAAAGLHAGLRLISFPGRSVAAAALALGIAALQIGAHYRGDDRQGDHFIRTHVMSLLADVPPNSILFTRHWDALVSPMLYLQEVEGLRRDVTVIDTELMRRPWYFRQLRRWDPELFAPVEDRLAAFLQQLVLFEEGKPYDPVLIESRYRSLILGLASLRRPGRPTVLTPDEDPIPVEKAWPVPEGLAYVLRDDPASSPPIDPPDVARLLSAGFRPQDEIHRQVVGIWGKMIRARIRFLTDLGRTAEVPRWQQAEEELRRSGALP